MALDTEIILLLNLNGRQKFSFYSYICKLGKHLVALFSYAIIYYIMQ